VCQQGTSLTSYILRLRITRTTKKSSLVSVRQIIRQIPAKAPGHKNDHCTELIVFLQLSLVQLEFLLLLLPLVVMLGRTQQKSQFVSIVVTAVVLFRSNLLLVTMEIKSTSRCRATDICRISLMWEVPTLGKWYWNYPFCLFLPYILSVSAKRWH
jgi:hypothetical protein